MKMRWSVLFIIESLKTAGLIKLRFCRMFLLINQELVLSFRFFNRYKMVINLLPWQLGLDNIIVQIFTSKLIISSPFISRAKPGRSYNYKNLIVAVFTVVESPIRLLSELIKTLQKAGRRN